MTQEKGFPIPLEVEYPKELEGWEEMYRLSSISISVLLHLL